MEDFAISTGWENFTKQQALDAEFDMIPKLTLVRDREVFHQQLQSCRPEIERMVARHLSIRPDEVSLSESCDWITGSFNACIPVDINTHADRGLPPTIMMRFVMPFAVGEDFSPSNVDEKVRCEAATYVWLRKNCPDIPSPRLIGFGFPGGQSFTAVENESIWNVTRYYLRRIMAWIRGEVLVPYFGHPRSILKDHGYLLLDWADGNMLSSTWQMHREDKQRRSNLYRGLAKVMLSFARVPLPRIGSWTMNDHGILSLSNRPLTDLTMTWGRHRIPTDVPRNMTYTSTVAFLHDLIRQQDNRMRHQLNAITDEDDGVYQLSALTALRAMIPRFASRESRHGPFVLTLPDLHQSNIFVDENWNITSLIDLEFAPVQPSQMTCAPIWLNSLGADELEGTDLEKYKILYDEFVDTVESEETARGASDAYSQRLRDDWHTERLWFSMALRSINGFPIIFEKHLQPKFYDDLSKDEATTLARLWDEDAMGFIASKVKDLEKYEQQVCDIFDAAEKEELQTKSTRE